ncbi:adenylosuccinate synthase [Verrucomicrobiales bacterium]|nr:adenylosuccinate synthase [Verrucomicrobiales bacterium]
MPNIIIVGAQWGDEGKGKIVDFLTETSDVVARSQGGNNAGHTVVNNDTKYVLHLVPSGILWEDKQCVIGNGVVIDPIGLVEEIEKLESQGVKIGPENLTISERAHITLPAHRRLDAARESGLGQKKIGTTGRGIGPTYADKALRNGLRMAHLRDAAIFREKAKARTEEANEALQRAGLEEVDFEATYPEFEKAANRLVEHLGDTAVVLHTEIKAGKSILFEGSQGTYLDIDHGTYPFVTSSNTTAGGACTGSGVSPRVIDSVVGVAKAYTTRVGEGPFITEDAGFSDKLHALGLEFGATTGRARRCGWLDLVLLRYASIVNGFDEIALTILDGLDDMDSVQVCVAYEFDGKTITTPPSTMEEWARCKPVYETLPGWLSDTTGIRKFSELPENARGYLAKVTEATGVPVTLVGVGPDREQTLRRD